MKIQPYIKMWYNIDMERWIIYIIYASWVLDSFNRYLTRLEGLDNYPDEQMDITVKYGFKLLISLTVVLFILWVWG